MEGAGLFLEPFLDYASWPYEKALLPGVAPWTPVDARKALQERLQQAQTARELSVSYYRIGYRFSFPLPLLKRPVMPAQVPGISDYPWVIWLSWSLEERWRVLHFAWRQLADEEAGLLLQQELAALAAWSSLRETANRVKLPSAHFAAVFSLALADPTGWRPEFLEAATTAARRLFEDDLWVWYKGEWSSQQMHNIPMIMLCRSAQLALTLGDERATPLAEAVRQAFIAWAVARLGETHFTEATAYDGYLTDSLTEFLCFWGDDEYLWPQLRETCEALRDQWCALTLPGRFDLHAPLGDVEPHMTFWVTALLRMARHYGWRDVPKFVRQVPLSRLPASALVESLEEPSETQPTTLGGRGLSEHGAAMAMRSGGEPQDCLVAVGLSRAGNGHLHCDGGSLVIGWQGRFWITDPGYQQYVRGEERNFTLGVQAHNAPVIGGQKQNKQAASLLVAEEEHDRQHIAVDLTLCYTGLPASASVRRDVWVVTQSKKVVVVRDYLSGFPSGEVRHSWHGGADLAWGFVDGWARLSNGSSAVWMGTHPGLYHPDHLTRHAGTRGPLTLSRLEAIEGESSAHWAVFVLEESATWQPPSLSLQQRGLMVQLTGREEEALVISP